MKLREIYDKPIHGNWDGGVKQVFDFTLERDPQKDKDGWYVRVGSFNKNFWFHVSVGKTEKQTWGNVKRRLTTWNKKETVKTRYEYVETIKGIDYIKKEKIK